MRVRVLNDAGDREGSTSAWGIWGWVRQLWQYDPDEQRSGRVNSNQDLPMERANKKAAYMGNRGRP